MTLDQIIEAAREKRRLDCVNGCPQADALELVEALAVELRRQRQRERERDFMHGVRPVATR